MLNLGFLTIFDRFRSLWASAKFVSVLFASWLLTKGFKSTQNFQAGGQFFFSRNLRWLCANKASLNHKWMSFCRTLWNFENQAFWVERNPFLPLWFGFSVNCTPTDKKTLPIPISSLSLAFELLFFYFSFFFAKVSFHNHRHPKIDEKRWCRGLDGSVRCFVRVAKSLRKQRVSCEPFRMTFLPSTNYNYECYKCEFANFHS